MRPRWSSGPNSPQFEPGGRCFHRCAMGSPGKDLEVAAADPLGDQRRLGRILYFHRGAPGDLHAALDLVVAREREARAHPRAAWHRSGEAHTVQAVVDAHLAVGIRKSVFREVRKQRQGEEAVRDGAAEGRGRGARRVDVDPLEIVDRLREGVDALLGDLEPGGHSHLLADAALERLYRRHPWAPSAIARAMRCLPCGSRIRASSAALTITPASTSTEGIFAVLATARLS